jgi:hypothetical protein
MARCWSSKRGQLEITCSMMIYDTRANVTLVRLVHRRGTKVKLSVGGWSGSKYETRVVEKRP